MLKTSYYSRATELTKILFVLSRLPLLVYFNTIDVHRLTSGEMANVVLEFKASAGDSEPQTRPVLIIGQQSSLQQVSWSQIKGKLQPVVSKEVKLGERMAVS